MNTVLLYSGGMDSTVLLYDLLARKDIEKIVCLGFDYSQRHKRELNAALEITLKVKVPFKVVKLDLTFGGSIVAERRRGGWRAAPSETPLIGESTIVPGRNLLFLSAATSHALGIGFDSVAIAAHAGDQVIYPDCREPFLAEFERLVQGFYKYNFTLLRPYVGLTKRLVVEAGRELRVPFDKTWSCYVGETLPCGSCGACIERERALGDWQNQGMTFAKKRVADGSNA